MIRKKYNNLFVFDLETTGLNFYNDNIIEIAILYYELDTKKNKFELTKTIDHLIKIDRKIPEEIVQLTNITDEMLEKSGVLEEEVVKEVLELINDKTLIIGYNVLFDYTFLKETLRKYDKSLDCDVLDVLAMYKDRYLFPHKLKDAIAKFNVSIPNSHRAIDDVSATFEVLKELIKIENDMHLYVNKIGYNIKYPIQSKIDRFTYIPQKGGMLEIKKAHH